MSIYILKMLNIGCIALYDSFLVPSQYYSS